MKYANSIDSNVIVTNVVKTDKSNGDKCSLEWRKHVTEKLVCYELFPFHQ
jgi:hypothetical protein